MKGSANHTLTTGIGRIPGSTSGDRHGLFYRMSGSGSTVFKVPGIHTRHVEGNPDLPPLQIPKGTKIIVTRTAESVVPVELLD